jgi:hypothetical protein
MTTQTLILDCQDWSPELPEPRECRLIGEGTARLWRQDLRVWHVEVAPPPPLPFSKWLRPFSRIVLLVDTCYRREDIGKRPIMPTIYVSRAHRISEVIRNRSWRTLLTIGLAPIAALSQSGSIAEVVSAVRWCQLMKVGVGMIWTESDHRAFLVRRAAREQLERALSDRFVLTFPDQPEIWQQFECRFVADYVASPTGKRLWLVDAHPPLGAAVARRPKDVRRLLVGVIGADDPFIKCGESPLLVNVYLGDQVEQRSGTIELRGLTRVGTGAVEQTPAQGGL